MGRTILAVVLALLGALPVLCAAALLYVFVPELVRIARGEAMSIAWGIGSPERPWLELHGWQVLLPPAVLLLVSAVFLVGAWLLWRGPARER